MGTLTKFPYGVSSFGIPVIGQGQIPATTGNYYFVSSVTGIDNQGTGYGYDPSKPFATINYAISKCTANNADVVVVMPGHTETISAAGSITANVAGVTVFGLGTGSLRPTLNWTATTGTVLISAANCTFENLYCTPTGIDAVVTPFSGSAAGTTFRRIECYFARTSYVALVGFYTATAAAGGNNLIIEDCFIHGDAVANCTNAIQLVGGANIKIRRNHISGAFTTTLGCINNITAAVTDIEIRDNILVNSTAGATKVIVLLTGSTGRICDNRIGILSGAAFATADAVEMVGANYIKSAVGTGVGTLA